MTDNINPEHYVLENGHQVIEVSENLTSNGGQAVQYIARATRTDGVTKENPVEDLKKAIWFIEREIGRITPAETLKSWTLTDLQELRNNWWGQHDPEWKITIGSLWDDPLVFPREWDNLENVPPNTIVEDKDGDQYKRVGGTAQFKVRYLDDATKIQYAHWNDVADWLWKDQDAYAPFREVTDG